MNGDGTASIAGVIVYFNNRDAAPITTAPERFDYDGNGQAGEISDVVTLFKAIS